MDVTNIKRVRWHMTWPVIQMKTNPHLLVVKFREEQVQVDRFMNPKLIHLSPIHLNPTHLLCHIKVTSHQFLDPCDSISV
jgi:hypothetical protein